MAEDLLGGILGGEDERPEGAAAETLASAEAFAASIAAIASRQDPQVARDTSTFLGKQSRLLDIQAKHLEEEHVARLHYLRGQAREVDIRRFGLRLRVAFQLFIALFATVIGIGIAVMLHDAFTSRSVVIEPFDAPPALVARGVTGKVVASGLLDELGRLQNATRADAAKRSLSNAWSNEIKLAVPEAGLTIGELSRVLRARFGHDLHIDGELFEIDAGGFALTVRGDGVEAKSFSGAAGELKKITSDAAEYVYSQSEPVLWAYYLNNSERTEESINFSKAAFTRADKEDRPYLLNTWGNALLLKGNSHDALTMYAAALKLKPDFWAAHNNVIEALWGLGNEEAAWRGGEEMRQAAGGRPGRAAEIYYQDLDRLSWNLLAWRDSAIADAESHGGEGSDSLSAGLQIADVDARLHDPAAAELMLQTIRADNTDPTIAAASHFVHGQLATSARDNARAASEMEAFGAAYVDPAVSSNFAGYNCWIAPVEEAAGHPDRADAVLKTAGSFVDCYRFRADILGGRGDWPGAQKAYAEAVALAPDLPAAYYSWGVALAGHGDFAGAESKLKDANQKGPHWADPLKAWGDMLVKQGRSKEALVKYDDALKYAPNWQQLKDAREALAKHTT